MVGDGPVRGLAHAARSNRAGEAIELNGSNDTPRIALMMDFENIVLGLPGGQKFKPKAILSRVLDLGKIVIKRAYADWSRYESQKTRLHELGFDLAEIPRRAMTGKNSRTWHMAGRSCRAALARVRKHGLEASGRCAGFRSGCYCGAF